MVDNLKPRLAKRLGLPSVIIGKVIHSLLHQPNSSGAQQERWHQENVKWTRSREQGAKLWELRTATSLAKLWGDQGDRTAAREVLAPIYQWFKEGWNTTDMISARAVLEHVGHS